MRKEILNALLILFVLSGTAFAAVSRSSVPASPFPFKATQPNGVEIEIFNRGDERLNWVENAKGYTLAKNDETGFWDYALLGVMSADIEGKTRYWLVPIPSGVIYDPSEEAPDDWPVGLRPTRVRLSGGLSK